MYLRDEFEDHKFLRSKRKQSISVWKQAVVDYFIHMGYHSFSEADIVRMMILVRRKIIRRPFKEDLEFKALVKKNKKLFYDLLKNPTQINTLKFFAEPLVKHIWAIYVSSHSYSEKLFKFNIHEREVIDRTFDFFLKSGNT